MFGCVTPETPLQLESQMAENGVIFSVGIEKDFLEFNSGAQASIGIQGRVGRLWRTYQEKREQMNRNVFQGSSDDY